MGFSFSGLMGGLAPVTDFFSKSFGKMATSIGTGVVERGSDYALTSIFGGPDRPRSGSELGLEAEAYYNRAFPGTNPWERLGTSAPAGPVDIARRQVDTQRDINKRQLATQQDITAKDRATRERIAEIGGRTAAVNAGAEFGSEHIKGIGDYIVSGGPSSVSGRSAKRETAKAATSRSKSAAVTALANELNSMTNRREHFRKAKMDRFERGVKGDNPVRAAMIALASDAYDEYSRRGKFTASLKKHHKKLLALGLTDKAMGEVAKIVGSFLLGGAAAKIGRKIFKPRRR